MRSYLRRLVVGASACAVVLAGLAAPPAVAAEVPAELHVLCAYKSSKVFRVDDDQACAASETRVLVPEDGTVVLCAFRSTGRVRRVATPSACAGNETPLVVPDDGSLFFCSADVSKGTVLPRGELRHVADASSCDSRTETPYVSPARPDAVDDLYVVDEDEVLIVPPRGVLENDRDYSGAALRVASSTPAGAGLLTIAPDGGLRFDPRGAFDDLDAGSTRSTTATYVLSDGALTAPPATVTLVVRGANDTPVAVADGFTTDEDTALSVLAPGVLGNDRDAEGHPLTPVLVEPPVGALRLDPDGGLRYDPSRRFEHLGTGEQAQDTFRYLVDDGRARSAPTTVTVTVRGVDDAPVGAPDAATTDENTELLLPHSLLLANDSDAEGSPLQVVDVSAPVPGGTLTPTASGLLFDPRAAFDSLTSGQTATATFTYRAFDGVLRSAPTTVTVSVTGLSAPLARDDSAATDEDTPVGIDLLLNDVLEGATLTLDTSGTTGAVALVGPGRVEHDPRGRFDALRPGASAVDSFSYVLRNDEGTSTGRVSVVVHGRNDAPQATDRRYDGLSRTGPTSYGAPEGVLVGATDADGDVLRAVLVAPPSRGRLELRPDGGFTFDPSGELPDGGTESFTYRAADGAGGESPTRTVTLLVGGTS